MIYISGGITGITEEEYMKRFNRAEEDLWNFGYEEIINPANVSAMLPELYHSEYMTVCMALLSLCDSIYMLKGYERSKGAMMELEYAKKHGYKVVYEDDRSNDD